MRDCCDCSHFNGERKCKMDLELPLNGVCSQFIGRDERKYCVRCGNELGWTGYMWICETCGCQNVDVSKLKFED